MEENSKRQNRVNEELKREISNIIDNEIKNSNITGLVTVTKVKVSPDIRYAKVYVSILNSKNKKQTLLGLKASSGFIRTRVAQTLDMRVTPELVFEFDESTEYAERIDSILNEIMQEINKEDE